MNAIPPNPNAQTDEDQQQPKPQPPWTRLLFPILTAIIVIIGHFLLERWTERWATWQLILIFLLLVGPALAWALWPDRVGGFFISAWSLWQRIQAVVGAAALVALVVLAVWWLVVGRRPEVSRIRFTCDSWIGWSPVYVAKAKRLFGETDVEMIPAQGSGQKRTLVYRVTLMQLARQLTCWNTLPALRH